MRLTSSCPLRCGQRYRPQLRDLPGYASSVRLLQRSRGSGRRRRRFITLQPQRDNAGGRCCDDPRAQTDLVRRKFAPAGAVITIANGANGAFVADAV